MLNGFKEEDKEKVIRFLNFVAKRAKFADMSIEDSIELVKLLTFMQQTLLVKINDNILEVVKVVKPQETNEETIIKKAKK